MRNRFAVLAAIMAMPLATASAQNAAPRNVITIQPLNAVLTVYAGEFERAATKAVTWGVGATHWNVGDAGDEVSYTSGDLKIRYYASGAALHGFSFGVSAGFSNVGAKTTTGIDETASGASAGVLIEYQWLMGMKKNFAVALGAGAKRLMISEDDVSSGSFKGGYPTTRLSVGYAF
jgi:hypothetical protein